MTPATAPPPARPSPEPVGREAAGAPPRVPAGPHGRGDDRPRPGDRIVARRSARVQFASATLVLEACAVLFATLGAYGLRTVPSVWPAGQVPTGGAIWLAGGALAVVLVVLSRLVAGPGGVVAGSLGQLPVLAIGIVVPFAFVVGAVFVVMWVVALRLGRRIDRERAAYDDAHPETAPNVD